MEKEREWESDKREKEKKRKRKSNREIKRKKGKWIIKWKECKIIIAYLLILYINDETFFFIIYHFTEAYLFTYSLVTYKLREAVKSSFFSGPATKKE